VWKLRACREICREYALNETLSEGFHTGKDLKVSYLAVEFPARISREFAQCEHGTYSPVDMVSGEKAGSVEATEEIKAAP
jgi:rRNA maturation protein Nop10